MNCDFCLDYINFNSFIDINVGSIQTRLFICPNCRKKIYVSALYDKAFKKIIDSFIRDNGEFNKENY